MVNPEPKFYVYEHHRNDTGAVFYVGKGYKSRSIARHNRNLYWQRVCEKAGGFFVTYPVKNVDEELALLVEVELIDAYRRRGVCITNITNGGEGAPGWVPSEETRRKIGEANKHTPKATGENHGMYGKKHTPESLAKMSAAQKGRMAGEKHHFYGKHHSEETRRKISENRKGKMIGADNPFYGKKHTPEALEKMRATHVGRKQSPEERAKRSASASKSEYIKSIRKPVLCLTNGIVYESVAEAARQLDVWREAIKLVCQGKLKSTGGYKFKWSK